MQKGPLSLRRNGPPREWDSPHFATECQRLQSRLPMDFRSNVNVFPCQVQWGDCDPAAIIFYPTYFRWMDAATWAFFESVGYTPKRMREEHLSMPLVSADCQFISPARHGDRCEVRSQICLLYTSDAADERSSVDLGGR